MSAVKTKDIEVASHEERRSPFVLGAEDREFLDTYLKHKQKAAVDWNLNPLLTFLYLMSYIDRTTIGNVKIEGIMDDLDLRGNRYNVAQCIFFAPYCLFDINSILSRVKKPSYYLGGLVVSWGLDMTFSGLVQSYEGLLTVSSQGAASLLAGVICLLCLPDNPALSTRILDPDEIRFLETRKRSSNALPNYAIKFNMPAVIKGMGYTSANAQLLTIPP
ncbi:hypothetical protein ACJ41O_012100 [Fusarium nematophilum]